MIDRLRCGSIILVILGILCGIGSALLFIYGNSLIESNVKQGCELTQGTPAYEAWRHPPVPLHISFYVFDLNDTDFLTNSSKIPFLRQRGPFVYKEVRTKSDVQEYENGSLSYHESRNYTFERSLSCDTCDETYNITTMNVVYMALVNFLQAENVDPIFQRIVGEILSFEEKPVMKRTVKEFLWGYVDPLLHLLKINFPDIVGDDHVSVYNASVSGAGLNTFLIDTGVDVHRNDSNRIQRVGNIERFNFETSVPYWSNEYANMINGTDSTLWHPDTKTGDTVHIFQSDLCRSLSLEYHGIQNNLFGIENYRFVLPSTVFANSSDNQGFCLNSTTANKTQDLKCLPSGLMSLQTCVKLSGSSVSIPLPIIASTPHFLDADPSVQNAVQGLNPDESIHRSFMDIEPITGTVMNGSRRMQVNLNVVSDKEITAISNLKPFVYPMIWLDEHAEIDANTASMFRSKVMTPMTILEAMKYVSLGLGGLLIVISIILLIYRHHKKNSTGPVFPTSNPDETSPLLV